MHLSSFKTTAKQVATEFSEKNVPFMAAGIAYHAFVSLVPLLILLLLTMTTVGGGLKQRILNVVQQSLPGPIADVVVQVFESGGSVAGTSIIGLLVLLWGALKIFRSLDTAFSEIYESTGQNSFRDGMTDGLVVFGGLLVALVATIGASTAFVGLAGTVPYVGYVTPLVLVAGLFLAFVPMFYVFPDTDVEWQTVVPGAVVAAVGWALFQSLFQLYLSVKSPGAAGVFSGVIVVATWLYFSSLVLLLGTVVNAVVGDHANGTPGGVGQGTATHAPEREETVTRSELDRYLDNLRCGRVGDGSERDEPDSAVPARSPSIDRDVELEEHHTVDDGEETWTVVLRWQTDSAGGDGRGERPATADD